MGGETRTPLRRLIHTRSGGCRRSDLRFRRTFGDRFCLLLSIVHPSIADPVRTEDGPVPSVADVSGAANLRDQEPISQSGPARPIITGRPADLSQLWTRRGLLPCADAAKANHTDSGQRHPGKLMVHNRRRLERRTGYPIPGSGPNRDSLHLTRSCPGVCPGRAASRI